MPAMSESLARPTAMIFRPHTIVMVVLFLGAALAGVLLLPGDAERVAMLERDGDNTRALSLLERRFEKGDRSQRTLYQLEQIYQHFGRLKQARTMLELLAENRPRDLVLQRRLVKFYRDVQDGDAYLSALGRLISRRYTEVACRELIGQLRLVGQFARERDAIERCRIKGYRREDDIVRLAELEGSAGNKARAITLLRSVDDVRGLSRSRDRLMLASLLVDQAESDDLVKRGTRWAKADKDERFSRVLLEFLGQRHAHDAAIRIARDAGKPGDGLSLSVAELMLDRDQISAARTYLRGWIEVSDIKDVRLASRVITAALDAEDPEVALLAARHFGMDRLPQQDLVKVAEALGATGRRAEFEIVHAALSADTIVAHPLLSAMVELNKGSRDATRNILSHVSTDVLQTWRLALWARLMHETGKGEEADAKLRSMGDAGEVVGPPRIVVAKRRATDALRTYRARSARLKARERRRKAYARLLRSRREAALRRNKFQAPITSSNKYAVRPRPIGRPTALVD